VWSTILPGLVVAAILALRFVALGADAYSRLDWSAGLLTDEGFYVHNARNVALFGHARTDGFNNMLLSPLLHYAQVAVFSVFGVGAVQARSISVVCSLLTLGLLFAALRRAFDNRIAWTAVAFLGLDHVSLLYNRMALMDTPAALPAVAAFYCFVRGQAAGGRERAWLGGSGVMLGITLVVRMLCGYLVPAPIIAVWTSKRETRLRAVIATAGGIVAVGLLYAAIWYLPHRAEIAPMNAYYRTHQIQPRSVAHLLENLRHAVVGDFRGISPYLFRHAPVLFALALVGLAASALRRREEDRNPAEIYLLVWLLLGVAMLAVISYSPSRYYVSVYPALASVAAITVWRLPEACERLRRPIWTARLMRGILAGFLAFHAALALVHYSGVLPPGPTITLIYGLPALAAAGAAAWSPGMAPRWIAPALVAAWALANGVWLLDWGRHIDYSQQRMSRWLAENLPPGSVLIGDVAPGVSLDNPFKAMHVQPGLVNDIEPVEKFAGAPRYIVILDGRWKERYWLDRYPELVAPNRRVKLARVLRWDVGVYAVDSPVSR
jgi:4-amino-4-deoxy-L-arabinose transferase-like glycosyltransferase